MASAIASYIDDPRFHRTFQLPSDPENGRTSPFKVTYADYGYRNEAHPEEENVFLFFGPLLSSRLAHISKDELAKKHKIRFINPDRPGVGGSDACAAKDRMSLWLEIIPALLKHLNIQHVSLGCHSGGVVYALDMLRHHPEILHPERPYVAIGAPWILPAHTNSTSLSIVQSLPASMIGSIDTIAKVVNNNLGPALGVSFGLSESLVSLFTSPSAKAERKGMDREGAKFAEEIWPQVMDRVYALGVKGMSCDAVLLMQKVDGAVGWGDWGDLDGLVPQLEEALREAGRKLEVDVLWAETDALIGDPGTKGPVWFERCWKGRDVIEYRCRVVEGADHDDVWGLRWGAIQSVFEKIGGVKEEGDGGDGVE